MVDKKSERQRPVRYGDIAILLRSARFTTIEFSRALSQHGIPCFAESRTGLDHVSFGVANRAELDKWQARFAELGVDQSPINDREGYAVLVFRDPDNIQLELMSFG